MKANIANKLVIAVSSSALFDLTESHRIFETEGIAAYAKYQIDREEEGLEPGPAFSVVKKLLALNQNVSETESVEVILLSRNSSDTGLRIFNAIEHYQLGIKRAAFTSGYSPYRYVAAFGAHLFLSCHSADVTAALKSGLAAARLFPRQNKLKENKELRIAFDGDAVLFADDAERVYQLEGLEAFKQSEKAAAREPLGSGPFKPFLSALHHLQAKFPYEECPIRTALVTARSAPAHERVIRTLRAWNIRIDEALFLGGLEKLAFLKAFDADIFFDDQMVHLTPEDNEIAAGHVPHGVTNPA